MTLQIKFAEQISNTGGFTFKENIFGELVSEKKVYILKSTVHPLFSSTI